MQVEPVNIIIPYRPLSYGSLRTPNGPIDQLPDGRWRDDDGEYRYSGYHRYGAKHDPEFDELIRAIKYLNKNSHFKHKIIVVVDSDVIPDGEYYKKFDNVIILKSRYQQEYRTKYLAQNRNNAALIDGINSIPDEDWLCYGYIADLICGKDWDRPIIEQIKQRGEQAEQFVYVPMFTEIRGGIADRVVRWSDLTPENIWVKWRQTICCHALTMPSPDREYFTEEDMDDFIKIANQYPKPPVIIEKPGDRIYGYYAVMFMKAKFAKKAIRMEGPGYDTSFDNRLYTECNLMKAVVTNSYIFHPFYESLLENR